MKPELRVALLGQGFMGKAHSNAYCQAGHFYDLPYRLRRTLLCGRDAASLAPMADRWGWEETATDWRAAIDRPDIDVVDIALPNHLHAPAAIAAAEAGKIVLCEKPLALSRRGRPRDGRRRRAACRRWCGSTTAACPAIAFARQLIADGRLGQIYHYNAAYRQQWGAGHVPRRHLADGSGAGRIGRRRRSADAPARYGAVSERTDHARRSPTPGPSRRTARLTMR